MFDPTSIYIQARFDLLSESIYQSPEFELEDLPEPDLAFLELDPMLILETVSRIYLPNYPVGYDKTTSEILSDDMRNLGNLSDPRYLNGLGYLQIKPPEISFPYTISVITRILNEIYTWKSELESSWSPSSFAGVAANLPVTYLDPNTLRRQIRILTFPHYDRVRRCGEIGPINTNSISSTDIIRGINMGHQDAIVGEMMVLFLVALEGRIKKSIEKSDLPN